MESTAVATGNTRSSLQTPDVGGGSTAGLPRKRRRARSSHRTGDAGLEEGVKGDDIDVFPLICDAEEGRPSDRDVAGTGDPACERLNAGLSGREVGGDTTREKRGVDGDVGRETSRAQWGSTWEASCGAEQCGVEGSGR